MMSLRIYANILSKVKSKLPKWNNLLAPHRQARRSLTTKQFLPVYSGVQQKTSLQGGQQTDRDCK
jgi:hypothetical protein